ncbi:programmed cell death 1 ligand 1-like [Echeneis naucrates]|uniref:Programmed cell death 1 ligand 1-like n=1 Tax=Echeneis naucrates TaxID=173247 RepID=A0A665VFD2_ECHNA|nr:programmed cell death 1 ligand 1-like [Echeneis naucrates]
MDWQVFVILQVIFQPSIAVFFTVESEQSVYTSEFGENVVMGCKFHPKPTNLTADLKVTWQWKTSSAAWEVYKMINGVEHSASQEYQGRVKLLTEELKDGWAKLQVSRLRINDSGTYQCLVQTAEGADYKKITLSVIAPYKAVTTCIKKAAGGDELLLTCQSEGYPESPVVWQDGHLQRVKPNTTAETTQDQLVRVTSWIRVNSSDKNNYTCNFTSNGRTAAFHIPDDILDPQAQNDTFLIALCIGLVMVVMIIAVVMYRRRKGFIAQNTRNLQVDRQGKPFTAANCQQMNENEATIIHVNEDLEEENLGVFLKTRYYDISFSREVRHHRGPFSAELSHRLQNNEGQTLKLQALLPEAGETLFLEGPPESGKTAVALILVSSWTEGPTQALTNPLDLSILQLLLYVNCSNVKGDLLQEIGIQLSLPEKTSTQHQLRTMLNRSSEVLLLLDGYREGNQLFDDSLRKFLSERRGCRVLVTACPGHCPVLKDTVGIRKVLTLQSTEDTTVCHQETY